MASISPGDTRDDPPVTVIPAPVSALAWTLGHFGENRLGLFWSEARQAMHCDGRYYVHEGATRTQPTHDLAHLMIAAGAELPWLPGGSGAESRLSEYNAVFIENLLCRLHHCAKSGRSTPEHGLSQTLIHARWFVEEHYKPFPVRAEEAYRRFCWGLDPEAVLRLTPLFYEMRCDEVAEPKSRKQPYVVLFHRQQSMPAHGEAEVFRALAGNVLQDICRRPTKIPRFVPVHPDVGTGAHAR